ncbi:MAG: S-layer homology domain-containing protein [Desertifilum sp. SIO1I2]|nr:S-layer homology domain-containing protein [Desertifilum sp. SIO1I2]
MLKLLRKISWSLALFAIAQPSEASFAQTQPPPSVSGCLTGYPDGSFRGNQPVTRYEFAAALNTCLDGVNSQLEGISQDAPTAEEIANFRRLLEQNRRELDSLNQRLDRLN